jgi:hypothetical protein
MRSPVEEVVEKPDQDVAAGHVERLQRPGSARPPRIFGVSPRSATLDQLNRLLDGPDQSNVPSGRRPPRDPPRGAPALDGEEGPPGAKAIRGPAISVIAD